MMNEKENAIPNKAHFVWFGDEFPWIFGQAVRTAALFGGFDGVVLHYDGNLRRTEGYSVASKTPGFEGRKLLPEQVLGSMPQIGGPLVDLYRRLSQPAAMSNMVRIGILAGEGGVYLDADVVSVRSFAPLLSSGFFCGKERIVLPASLMKSRNPFRWGIAGARLVARDLLRRVPGGWRTFRRIESLFPAVANNAVMGATAGHPLLEELLFGMVDMDREEQLVRFALGTHLLERTLAETTCSDVVVFPPRRFYPLGPEISCHWFGANNSGGPKAMLFSDSVCVHWYASVRTKSIVPLLDENYVRKHKDSSPFCSLLNRLLEP